MKDSNRIIVNTLAQYIRTILNMLLSLISVRLVLNILGESDYGIYMLVAGLVTMLSFITNSLVDSTQRFLSIHQGEKDIKALKNVFSNSLLLHIFIGLLVLIVLECLTPFLFDGFLNIPSERVDDAAILYQMVVVMVYISFVTAPFRALLVSRENIVYTSIIDVINGVLKVLLVLLLIYLPSDKLIDYGWIMLGISIFTLLAFALYTYAKYEECVLPRINDFDKKYLKDLGSFTGWLTYSSLCLTLRNQGLAIVLNKLRGTVINAAYGIGMQITGMVSFVSSSLGNAVAPQLIAAKGATDNQRMWFLAECQSKYSYLLLAMVGIPTMFVMQPLLELWLGEAPPNTMTFGCMFISAQIIDTLTSGLGTANRAIGKIGKYIFFTTTPKFLVLPAGWYILYLGLPMIWVAIFYVGIEAVCMYLRIPLLHKAEGFKATAFCKNVILKSLLPTFSLIITCFALSFLPSFPASFFITYIVSIPVFLCSVYKWSLSIVEKNKVNSLLVSLREKIYSFSKRKF